MAGAIEPEKHALAERDCRPWCHRGRVVCDERVDIQCGSFEDSKFMIHSCVATVYSVYRTHVLVMNIRSKVKVLENTTLCSATSLFLKHQDDIYMCLDSTLFVMN